MKYLQHTNAMKQPARSRPLTNLRPLLWALIAFCAVSLYMAWDIGNLPDAPLSVDEVER